MALPLLTSFYHGLQYLPQGKDSDVQMMNLLHVYCKCVLSSLMLHRPLQFVDLTKLKTEKSHHAFHPNNNTRVQTNTSDEEARLVTIDALNPDIHIQKNTFLFRDVIMEDHVIEDIGEAADELEEITERFIQSVGVSAVESMMT